MKTKGKRNIQKLALSQILILVIGIIAISYSIGSEIGIAKASSAVKECDYKGGANFRVCQDDSKCDHTKCNTCYEWCLASGKWSGTCDCTPALGQKTTIKETKEDPSSLQDPSKVNKEVLTKEEGDSKTIQTNTCPGVCKSTCSANETNLGAYDDCKSPKKCCGTGAEKKDLLGGLLSVKKGGALDAIINGFMWAGIVYAIIKFAGPMLGLEQELVDAASIAAFWGVFAGQSATTLLTEQLGEKAAGLAGAGIGAAVGIVVFILNYVKEKQEIITFTCYPWDAPTGGESCEECNKQDLPCSEYQCRSLGQACQLLNVGTDQEKCAWVNKNDVSFPVIEPWEDVLLKDYEYRPNNAISPPDRGVQVWNRASSTGCAKAFTPLSFGVTLNEPAKCKIDGIRKKSFDEMDFYFSGSLSLYNHSYELSLPGPTAFASENITIGSEGEYRLYVRCQDANGNSNTAAFVFDFCVEKGPDTTPPLIVTTDPLNGNPISYNQSSVDVKVYVNEPASCRWSHLDQDYENMEEEMSCSSSIFEMNAQMLYTCDTTLTGLKDKQDNNFYFKCKDNAENENKESYKFILIGTQPLVIDWVEPEDGETIKDSTDTVKVTLEAKTSAGYNEGEASCYYSDTGLTEDYVMFFNTGSYQHSQDLWLPELGEGEYYEYYIKCIDLGGNSDTEIVTFYVESDSSPPIVVRAYHEETYLKLITDEPADCVYDTKYEDYPCDYSFEDGTPLTTVEEINHYTDWNTETNFYIICQDEYGSQPAPNECSIIVRPSELY